MAFQTVYTRNVRSKVNNIIQGLCGRPLYPVSHDNSLYVVHGVTIAHLAEDTIKLLLNFYLE